MAERESGGRTREVPFAWHFVDGAWREGWPPSNAASQERPSRCDELIRHNRRKIRCQETAGHDGPHKSSGLSWHPMVTPPKNVEQVRP